MKKLFISIFISIMFISCNDNYTSVNLGKGISARDIKIRMEVLGGFEITDIYKDGKQYNIPSGYGENEWYFLYKDSLKGYLRHIKTNRNDRYSYFFSFYKENGKVFVEVDIKGVSALKRKIELE